MINIVVVSHGNLAGEMVESARMIIGDCSGVYSLSLPPEDSPETFGQKLEKIITEIPGQEYLILIDIFGGTPSNTAAHLVMKENIECVTGVNLPMLLEAILNRDTVDIHQLAANITDKGIESIKILRSIFG